jgi:serine/threonine-protein kinase RsbW
MPSSVVITIPPDPAYVGLLRSAAAHIGSRADFTLEEIEDLRMAVSEAATLLLDQPSPIEAEFQNESGAVTVTCRVKTNEAIETRAGELPWIVLEALVDRAQTMRADGVFEIELSKARAIRTT